MSEREILIQTETNSSSNDEIVPRKSFLLYGGTQEGIQGRLHEEGKEGSEEKMGIHQMMKLSQARAFFFMGGLKRNLRGASKGFASDGQDRHKG